MVDVMNRKALDLSNIQWLVLDEADEMLNMGFKDELDKLLKDTPKDKQTLLFSATFPKEVERIAKNYLVNPHEMSAGKKNTGADSVTHKYFEITPRNRYYALKRIVDVNPGIYGIVFCRTKRETQEVADKLINDNYNADSLHGDLSQVQRDVVMKKFRQKNLQILVATDVAARGLDVNDLTHVINYNLPDQAAAYTHRSGRTGRAGKKGDSMVLVSGREKGRLAEIERKIGKKFVKTAVPNGKEVCRNQVYHLIDRVKEAEVNESEIKEFLPKIYEKLADFDREELIKRFVSLEFNIFLSYYENTADLNVEHASNDSENMTRYFINIGKKDHLSPSK
ncbi:MAG: DEAD/DEAH box helicase, partial [Bacteroidetes bacterium]